MRKAYVTQSYAGRLVAIQQFDKFFREDVDSFARIIREAHITIAQ